MPQPRKRKRHPMKITWQEIFGCTIPDRGNSDSGAAAASTWPRAGAAARSSSDDAKRSGTLRRNRRFETLSSELDRRVGERSPGALLDGGGRRSATRAAAKAAGGLGMRSTRAEYQSDAGRAHAIDRKESDRGRCQQSENTTSSKSKRRKEHLQDSSSVCSRKVQDVVPLDDGEVKYEMSDRRNEPKIYYPSRDDPEAVELTSSDIECLEPGRYLSSPVINNYIQNIKKSILKIAETSSTYSTRVFMEILNQQCMGWMTGQS